MSSEVAMMQVKLTGLKKDRKSLRMRAVSLCESITPRINTGLYEIEEMDIAEAATLMDTLVTIQAELLSVNSKIIRLERSLGK